MERPGETSPERSARDRITEFFSWDTERYPEAHPFASVKSPFQSH